MADSSRSRRSSSSSSADPPPDDAEITGGCGTAKCLLQPENRAKAAKKHAAEIRTLIPTVSVGVSISLDSTQRGYCPQTTMARTSRNATWTYHVGSGERVQEEGPVQGGERNHKLRLRRHG